MQYNYKKYSLSISTIRVIATIFILLCHIASEYEGTIMSIAGQLFSVGVIIFFFMSGFLYGDKKIDNPIKWIWNRFKRLMIPIYIFLIFLIFILWITDNKTPFFPIVHLVFDIQAIMNTGLLGTGHLWFVTIIMICYLITPLLCVGREQFYKKKYFFGIAFLLVLFQVIVSYSCNYLYGIYLVYLYIYIAGFCFKNIDWQKKLNKPFIILLVSLFAGLLRFVLRVIVDGTILYSNIIVPYTQAILGIGLFIFFLSILMNTYIPKNIHKLILHLDKISYETYIVHYMFCVGPIALIGFVTHNYFIDTIIFIVFAYISANILHYITNAKKMMRGGLKHV